MHVPALCLLDVWSTAGFSTLNSAILLHLLQMYSILWFEAHGYCFGRCVFEPIPSRSTSQPSQRSYDLALHSNCILMRYGAGKRAMHFLSLGELRSSLLMSRTLPKHFCASPHFFSLSHFQIQSPQSHKCWENEVSHRTYSVGSSWTRCHAASKVQGHQIFTTKFE